MLQLAKQGPAVGRFLELGLSVETFGHAAAACWHRWHERASLHLMCCFCMWTCSCVVSICVGLCLFTCCWCCWSGAAGAGRCGGAPGRLCGAGCQCGGGSDAAGGGAGHVGGAGCGRAGAQLCAVQALLSAAGGHALSSLCSLLAKGRLTGRPAGMSMSIQFGVSTAQPGRVPTLGTLRLVLCEASATPLSRVNSPAWMAPTLSPAGNRLPRRLPLHPCWCRRRGRPGPGVPDRPHRGASGDGGSVAAVYGFASAARAATARSTAWRRKHRGCLCVQLHVQYPHHGIGATPW